MVREISVPRRFFASVSRPLLVIILLLLVVAMGLDGALWPRLSPWLARWWPAESQAPTPPVRLGQRDGEERTLPLLADPRRGG